MQIVNFLLKMQQFRYGLVVSLVYLIIRSHLIMLLYEIKFA